MGSHMLTRRTPKSKAAHLGSTLARRLSLNILPNRMGLRTRPRALLALAVLVALLSLTGYLSGQGSSSVCLVGNAESPANVVGVYESWGKQFPATYYIWGSHPDLSHNIYEGRVTFVHREGENLPFADGMQAAIQVAMRKHRCQYIFTHDDDLKFYLTPNLVHPALPGEDAGVRLANRLRTILALYQPAIASFPWDVGDNRFEGMIKLKEKWKNFPVAPLTGFDNGMVVYHWSVLDFFLVSSF